ncbi:peptide-methionine (S)-S-oxide reductase MsrA [Campylobacterota bacterium]
MQTAILGGGCFWCIEAVYSRAKGVQSAISGYAGGENPNPTYQEICTGATGHAEVVKVIFDENIISYEDILDIFFEIHDPTSLNRQGADTGTQYRSVIYYLNEEQRDAAEAKMEELQKSLPSKIVTELSAAPEFFDAEGYHQDYLTHNPNQGYCQAVVAPKVQKFMMKFREFIK